MHAGGKFGGQGYKVSGGLHGVGMSVVNALSEWLEVQVCRENKVFHQRFERGKTVTKLKVIGPCKKSGTKISFKPDTTIFEDINYDFNILSQRLRELSFLNKGLKITLKDERNNNQAVFLHNGGIVDFVKYINKNKDAVNPKVIFFENEKDGVQVEVALQYTDTYTENIFSYANNIHTHEGGTHESGFKSALTRIINDYARKQNILKENDNNLTGEDIREGLTAVLSVKVPEPQFEGQTKTKLGNSEVRGIVESIVNEQLATFLEENPSVGKKIIEKAVHAARARKQSKARN